MQIIAAFVVAVTFVTDARSKIVEVDIFSAFLSYVCFPYAFSYTMLPSFAIKITAPGKAESLIAFSKSTSIFFKLDCCFCFKPEASTDKVDFSRIIELPAA